MDPTLASLVAEVSQLGNDLIEDDGSPELKHKLLTVLDSLSVSLQSGDQLLDKLFYSPANNLFVKTALDLGIFKILSGRVEPLHTYELATLTSADRVLLERILRGLASVNAVKEAGYNLWLPSKLTEALTTVKGSSGIEIFHDFYPAWYSAPAFLAKTGYKNPSDPSNTPFCDAYGMSVFQWLGKNPRALDNFNHFMTAQREGRDCWLDFFPFEAEIVSNTRTLDGQDVIFVDAGGSFGHEIKAVQSRHPNLPGKFVLQDLPATIEQVSGSKPDSMEAMVHDFFTPQPVVGARAYYFRNILHDWSDEQCQEILRHTCKSMDKQYSKVLINEFVIPSTGASSFVSQSDFNMMALCAALERTEDHWRQLLRSVGLRIEKIWSINSKSESLIVAVLDDTIQSRALMCDVGVQTTIAQEGTDKLPLDLTLV